MQYIPATILWILALIKLPHARDTLSRHVFWAALFAAVGCTLYAPSIYIAVDTALGVTQGFLEFTVEDYLATSQTEGRYQIQVNNLDPLGALALVCSGLLAGAACGLCLKSCPQAWN